MKTISLTRNKFAIVDDEDYVYLNQWKWSAISNSNGFYAKRNDWAKGKNKAILMHRIILNVPKGLFADHINHNTLDNRKENLRIVTYQQNCLNKIKQRNNISGYKGVSFHKAYKNKWRVKINLNRKLLFHEGTKTKMEAAKLYDIKAKEFFGEYACLNFPVV